MKIAPMGIAPMKIAPMKIAPMEIAPMEIAPMEVNRIEINGGQFNQGRSPHQALHDTGSLEQLDLLTGLQIIHHHGVTGPNSRILAIGDRRLKIRT